MSGFHEVRFPDNIAYGATGGPEFATTMVATGSGPASPGAFLCEPHCLVGDRLSFGSPTSSGRNLAGSGG